MKAAIERLARACLELPLLVGIGALMLTAFGIYSAPFAWDVPGIERDPVPVDAIPDTADNQQIVFSRWPGRSPQDVEDQVTYPLTVSLLGVPGVRSLRSSSMFGASWVYVIFEEGSDIYESRSRILEKLASLPASALPENVRPTLGPDATALGQVFWYTLEGRTEDDQPAGGYDLAELREIQDWTVRYALASVPGVAEVASIGGFVREYQVDVDPARLFAHGVTLSQVFAAVRSSNLDVGARTMEVNRAEYVVRGLGRLEDIEDLEAVGLRSQDGVALTLRQVADVHLGPALRRGALERDGAEAVGGVVVARYGSNPMEVIEAVKQRIAELAPSLPTKQLDGGGISQVTIRPFYDRTELIEETLDTL
ncbi:MAG: Cu(I)/Ag(I) efflux system membrane protein CusA/SilA, partial [Planctomycetota bacterium]